jgi:hypothetical protein
MQYSEHSKTEDFYTGEISIKKALFKGLPEDPPFLEALGIDLEAIKKESLLPIKVLTNPSEIITSTSDLTGPITILIIFTFSLLLQGKVHFEYIYLISLSSSFFIYALINLLCSSTVGFFTCCNILISSLTPVVTFSFFNLPLKFLGLYFRIAVSLVMGIWSAFTASHVFCKQIEQEDKKIVLGYPLFLSYSCFL